MLDRASFFVWYNISFVRNCGRGGRERLTPTGTYSLLPLEPRNSVLATFGSKLHRLKITEVGRSILTSVTLMGYEQKKLPITSLKFNLAVYDPGCFLNLKRYILLKSEGSSEEDFCNVPHLVRNCSFLQYLHQLFKHPKYWNCLCNGTYLKPFPYCICNLYISINIIRWLEAKYHKGGRKKHPIFRDMSINGEGGAGSTPVRNFF